MPDNTSIKDAAGVTVPIATDDVGSGVQVQRIKPVWGVDGVALDTSATNPLPVSVVTSSVGATTATDTGTVTGGQSSESVVLALRYSFDGTNWTRAGATTSRTVSAATTNATSVKASAGVVYGITCNNANVAVRYLKLYNKASAPTVGTDVPRLTLMLPAGGGYSENYAPTGLVFETGIAFALTVEATDAGTTAVAAAEHVVHIHYK